MSDPFASQVVVSFKADNIIDRPPNITDQQVIQDYNLPSGLALYQFIYPVFDRPYLNYLAYFNYNFTLDLGDISGVVGSPWTFEVVYYRPDISVTANESTILLSSWGIDIRVNNSRVTIGSGSIPFPSPVTVGTNKPFLLSISILPNNIWYAHLDGVYLGATSNSVYNIDLIKSDPLQARDYGLNGTIEHNEVFYIGSQAYRGTSDATSEPYSVYEVRLTNATRYPTSNYPTPTGSLTGHNVNNLVIDTPKISTVVTSTSIAGPRVDSLSLEATVISRKDRDDTFRFSDTTAYIYRPATRISVNERMVMLGDTQYSPVKVFDGIAATPLNTFIESANVVDTGGAVGQLEFSTANAPFENISTIPALVFGAVGMPSEIISTIQEQTFAATESLNSKATMYAIPPFAQNVVESLSSLTNFSGIESAAKLTPVYEAVSSDLGFGGIGAPYYRNFLLEIFNNSSTGLGDIGRMIIENYGFSDSFSLLQQITREIIDQINMSELGRGVNEITDLVTDLINLESAAREPRFLNDLIVDLFNLSDLGIPITNLIELEDSFRVTMIVSEIIRKISRLTDQFILRDNIANNTLFTTLVDARLTLIDYIRSKVSETLADNLMVSTVPTLVYIQVEKIINELRMEGSAVSKLEAVRSVTAGLRFLDTILLNYTMSLTDQLVLESIHSVLSRLQEIIQEAVNLSLLDLDTAQANVNLHSVINYSDTLDALQTLLSLLLDGFSIAEGQDKTQPLLTKTFTFQPETSSVTTFSEFNFSGMAKFNNDYLLINNTGLYQYGGTKDDGRNIKSTLTTSATDFSTTNLKSLSTILLGVSTDNTLIFKLSFDDKGQAIYKLNKRTDNLETLKLDTGKGILGRYFQLELVTEADNFALERITFYPIDIKRAI